MVRDREATGSREGPLGGAGGMAHGEAARGPHGRSLVLALSLVAVVPAAIGCVAPPPYRQQADFQQRFERVRTITLVPPKIAVYKVSAGDTEEEVQAWSDAAHAHVVEAVKAEVAELGREYVPYAGEDRPHADHRLGAPPPGGGSAAAVAGLRGSAGSSAPADRTRTPAEESWLLFEAANLAIMRHTYDAANTFPTRMKDFGYTLGPEGAALLGGTEADAFLLVVATDHIPSRGRQALVAAGLGMAAMKGSYAGPGWTPARLTLALVEARTGDILWYNQLALPLSDLRDADTDRVLVDMVMKGLEQ